MFTGIVQGVGEVALVEKVGRNKRLQIQFPEASMQGQQLGASVAINGVCLTVAEISTDQLTFDVIDTTLALTNIGELTVGSKVNFERAARIGDEIGGHLMSGHIMTTVSVVGVEQIDESVHIRFTTDRQQEVDARRYLFDKGYVGLNGASLTISNIGPDWLEVSLIPETLRLTNFVNLVTGSRVNLEIDAHTQATVDTVERILQNKA
ncbi:riboflavin synthase subunit alpha [Marinomonas dokdonensis]|uniref:riboflavin synthase subunit alpha n=1 Tax=Marinomonas dokdonensis TaxID=328224 RepID=UPI004055403E